jgi:phytoene synthase
MDHREPPDVADAYRHCWQIATRHYENFTVGSWLLPRHLRRHIAAVYAFARTADDFADEGSLSPAQRRSRLDAWERELDACYRGHATHPVFVALGRTVQQFAIPSDPFRHLLDAFRQDTAFVPFESFAALCDYCRRSANPVGHVMLYLFGYRDTARQALADQICTGLQLANFWQDVRVDADKGRVYLPREDLHRFGCSAEEISRGHLTTRLRELLAFQVGRTRDLLLSGEHLAQCVDRRLAREVRLFAWGGLAILRKIEAVDYDVFTRRPTLSMWSQARLVIRAWSGVVDERIDLAEGVEHAQGARRNVQGQSPHPPATEQFEESLEADPGLARDRRSSTVGVHRQDVPCTTAALREAYAYCEALTRRSSSNFAYAFRLLGPERRHALHAVYAFCRFVDDIADDEGHREPAPLLARWRDELERVYAGSPTHPIGHALADAARRFDLRQQHFADLMRGVEMDLTRTRYASFDELHEYCYLVASTVGLLCIEIFGYREASARDYAVDLGIAFQLTNILRDVLEDGRRRRIYLPLEDLRRFDCTEEELLRGRYSARLGALMAFECGRARAYYLRARGALAPADRASLAAAEAMRLIYERLLDRIEARHFDVFGAKVTLPRYQKITLAMAAWGRSQLAVLGS